MARSTHNNPHGTPPWPLIEIRPNGTVRISGELADPEQKVQEDELLLRIVFLSSVLLGIGVALLVCFAPFKVPRGIGEFVLIAIVSGIVTFFASFVAGYFGVYMPISFLRIHLRPQVPLLPFSFDFAPDSIRVDTWKEHRVLNVQEIADIAFRIAPHENAQLVSVEPKLKHYRPLFQTATIVELLHHENPTHLLTAMRSQEARNIVLCCMWALQHHVVRQLARNEGEGSVPSTRFE